jgi:hypothetical protein
MPVEQGVIILGLSAFCRGNCSEPFLTSVILTKKLQSIKGDFKKFNKKFPQFCELGWNPI